SFLACCCCSFFFFCSSSFFFSSSFFSSSFFFSSGDLGGSSFGLGSVFGPGFWEIGGRLGCGPLSPGCCESSVGCDGCSGPVVCQLVLTMPPEIVSITDPSALTCICPAMAKSPITGSIDHKSNSIPGAQLAVLGNVNGAGCVKVISAG